MKSHKGFDRLSWIYDFLVKIIFGSSIRDAQINLIQNVQTKKGWLIIGGGTGWILEDIFKYHPEAQVTYLEASQGMIDKAKSRKIDSNVNYILGSVDQIPSDHQFDIVVTNFFWDMFLTQSAIDIKNKIDEHLNIHAQWLVVDFKNADIWWQRALMKIMYWFFRITCGIEARSLPDFEELFVNEKKNQVYRATFYQGMIESHIYQKEN
jgi:ubiquinone/menaquinone biosynthesis C-methylase UbiE